MIKKKNNVIHLHKRSRLIFWLISINIDLKQGNIGTQRDYHWHMTIAKEVYVLNFNLNPSNLHTNVNFEVIFHHSHIAFFIKLGGSINTIKQ